MQVKTMRIIPVIVLIVTILSISGCGNNNSSKTSERSSNEEATNIQIKGSDTMLNLGTACAESYMKNRPQANIIVTDGGSSTGIAALIDGNTDIAQASRPIKDEERKLAEDRGVKPADHVVGLDALSIVVNHDNAVKKLTIPQASGIFSGKITNWKQVGGKDAKIDVVVRNKTSGTYAFFLEHVIRLGKSDDKQDYVKSATRLTSNEAIAAKVGKDKDAIGYVGLEFVNKTQHTPLAVAKSASGPYVLPSMESALSGKYPVSRALHWYTNGEPHGEVKDLVGFVLSEEGQKIIKRLGFAPVRK
jgi:phosphate transport system substrate-binding protein